jgi:indole-3-glycerol phosphate synthase
MNILDTIVLEKRKEVEGRKELYPIKLLEKSIYFENPCISLSQYVLRNDKLGIIAEFKRKSPSKGIINEYADIRKVSVGYMQAGASALSILTDEKFFGGALTDLSTARNFNFCPVLRKDFIIDEYQIVEAKSIGADAVLLIAAILSPDDAKKLAGFAKSLGLEVLLEIHVEDELNRINSFTELVGVNNRNLKDFSVDIVHSIKLAALIPDGFIRIAESGISNTEIYMQLKENGFHGFLMGEKFMATSQPHLACQEFITSLRIQFSKKGWMS